MLYISTNHNVETYSVRFTSVTHLYVLDNNVSYMKKKHNFCISASNIIFKRKERVTHSSFRSLLGSSAHEQHSFG